MKPKIILLTIFIGLIFLNGCTFFKSNEEINELNFCRSLELKDYYINCSNCFVSKPINHNVNYTLECQFESKRFNEVHGCTIDWYLKKVHKENANIFDTFYCKGYSISNAISQCRGQISGELGDVRMIFPSDPTGNCIQDE